VTALAALREPWRSAQPVPPLTLTAGEAARSMWGESESDSSDVEFMGFKDAYDDDQRSTHTEQVAEEEPAVSKEQTQADADDLASRLIGDALKRGHASLVQIKQALSSIGMSQGRAGERHSTFRSPPRRRLPHRHSARAQ
jgi:hypothetical protein